MLESPEERLLYPAVLGISPVRIGGANEDRLQPRPNFWSEIVEQVAIVPGIADIDTLRRSHHPALFGGGEVDGAEDAHPALGGADREIHGDRQGKQSTCATHTPPRDRDRCGYRSGEVMT